MSTHPSWRVVVSLVTGAIALGSLAVPVSAQAPTTAQVAIAPIGPSGISGLALLGPADQGGTTVQILVSGAAGETFGVIHAGTCDAIDPTPLALLGDVSATSQVTITNAFEGLTDGRHVLALHAGLDLATAVGCGAIPRVERAEPDPAPSEPAVAGGSFTGPLTGFGIAWPSGWQRYDVIAVEGEDRIGLGDGSSSVLLAARLAPDGDPQACVRDARQELFDRLDAGTLRDLAPVTGDDGSTVSGVETDRAWLAYRYVSVAQDGEADIADHLECRKAGDVLLYILHRSSPSDFGATQARQELLTGLMLPGAPRPVSTVEPGPTGSSGGGSVPLSPPPSPAPTLDAACEGYPAWHDTTLQRVDRLASLRSEEVQGANDVLVSGDPGPYRAILSRLVLDVARLRVEQEGQAAPVAATDAQARAIDMFQGYGTAGEILSSYYETSTDMITLRRAQDAQKAAEQAQRDFEDALVSVEAVCG